MPINPDRIRLLEVADRRPMKDIFDNDFEGPIVDLGIDLDRYFGHVFIKTKHFEFIAREFLGMKSKQEWQQLLELERDKNVELEEALVELNALKAERQESFNAKLTEFLANYDGSAGNAANSVSPVATDDAANKASGTDSAKAKAKGSGSEGNLDGL